MAINYTWNVSTVDTYPTLDGNVDVVYNVHWKLNAEDTDNNNCTASIYGTQVVDTADIGDFIAFADLTNSDVQGWVEAAIGADEVQSLKDKLDALIAEKITPTSVTKTIG